MSEINQLIEQYEKKIAFYQAMIAELRIAQGATSSADTPSPNGTKPTAGDDDYLSLVRANEFFNKSQPDAAKAFLERVGHPMKTREILEAIKKGGVTIGGKTPQTQKQNFYTILFRGADFVLYKRDTWALTVWPGMKKLKEEAESKKDNKGIDDLLS